MSNTLTEKWAFDQLKEFLGQALQGDIAVHTYEDCTRVLEICATHPNGAGMVWQRHEEGHAGPILQAEDYMLALVDWAEKGKESAERVGDAAWLLVKEMRDKEAADDMVVDRMLHVPEKDCPRCDICRSAGKKPGGPVIGVCASPMGAISRAVCRECLNADREMWSILVGGLIGVGQGNESPWATRVIAATCEFHGRTVIELWADVERTEREYDEAMGAAE